MSNMNIPQLKVNELVEMLTTLHTNAKPTDVPALMMWGPVGIGKSQSIKEVARRLAVATDKKVNTRDVRLLLFNPVDLRGIPVADTKRELAKWLKPEIFQLDESPDTINILVLDEISAAPLSVQAAAYQMTLDRVVGEHKIPDNTIIICAGNRVTDKSVAYKMPKALCNRMTHVEISPQVDDWKAWAIPHGIDAKIIAYINFSGSKLNAFDPQSDDVAFPTPRSWEMVDKYLKQFNGSIKTAFPLIAGSIGLGAATEFKAYTEVFHDLPSVVEIFAGKTTKVPKNPDALYALSAAMVAYATTADESQLANFVKYMGGFPTEFASLTFRDVVTVEELRNKLVAIPEFKEWGEKNKFFIF